MRVKVSIEKRRGYPDANRVEDYAAATAGRVVNLRAAEPMPDDLGLGVPDFFGRLPCRGNATGSEQRASAAPRAGTKSGSVG